MTTPPLPPPEPEPTYIETGFGGSGVAFAVAALGFVVGGVIAFIVSVFV